MADQLPVCNYPECGGTCLECKPAPGSNWQRHGLGRPIFAPRPANCPECSREGFLHATWCRVGMDHPTGAEGTSK